MTELVDTSIPVSEAASDDHTEQKDIAAKDDHAEEKNMAADDHAEEKDIAQNDNAEKNRLASLEVLDGIVAEEDMAATSSSLQLGYKTFTSSKSCLEYFKKVLFTSAPDIDLNEYEYLAVLDLLKKGHPDAAKKIGVGLRAIQARAYDSTKQDVPAFFAVRKDGSMEDFSYVKCVSALFPKDNIQQGVKRPWTNDDSRPSRGRQHGARGRGRWMRGRR